MTSFFRSKNKQRSKAPNLLTPLDFANQHLTKSAEHIYPESGPCVYPNAHTLTPEGITCNSLYSSPVYIPPTPTAMSLTEANALIKKQQARIEELENVIRERDVEIEGLKAKLDMTQSILDFKDSESGNKENNGAGDGGKRSVYKQRGIGISAEPAQNLGDIKLVKHNKTMRLVTFLIFK